MPLSRVIAIGDGVTTQFAISYTLGYLSEDDITCRVGEEVDGGGDPVYRDLTFINPGLVEVLGAVPGDGVRVVFDRTMDETALLVDFADGDVLNDENLTLANKQIMYLVHQLLDGRFNAFSSDLDMGGFQLKNLGEPTDDGDAVTLGYILENALDAGAAAAAAAQSAIEALASAVAADASADAAAASEASVTADAATASAAATTATTQAGIATTKATEADASADAALASEVAAALAEVNAETAETNAELAEANAETAEANAETAQGLAEDARDAAIVAKDAAEAALASTLAAYDSFDDRYLGSKTSDPTLDNDGNALVGGALYYNSVAEEMRLYTGSAWVAAYVSGGGFLATSGGTMTGAIVLTGDPASDLHAAPKQYVDARVLRVGDTLTGQLIGKASDTTSAPFRMPHGVAPTSPVNGDIWTTSGAVLVRLTGSTYNLARLEGTETVTGAWQHNATLSMSGAAFLAAASAAGYPSIRLPHGSAPSSPTNGDMWTTSADGLFARVNGVTYNFQTKLTTLAGYGITDAAAKTQNLEGIAGVIEAPDNQSYTLVLKAPHGGTITETTTKCLSGTCTMTFKVNTTALGGTANSVSSSEQSQAHGSSNTFAAGDDIVVTVSSNSSCVDASFTIKYSRGMD